MLEYTDSKRRVFSVLAVVFLVLTAMTGSVAADDGGIICSGNSEEKTAAEQIFTYVIGLFMIMGFALGVVMWSAERFEASIFGDAVEVFGGVAGKEALKNAILIPIIVWFFDLIAEPAFGINISCIVPSLG